MDREAEEKFWNLKNRLFNYATDAFVWLFPPKRANWSHGYTSIIKDVEKNLKLCTIWLGFSSTIWWMDVSGLEINLDVISKIWVYMIDECGFSWMRSCLSVVCYSSADNRDAYRATLHVYRIIMVIENYSAKTLKLHTYFHSIIIILHDFANIIWPVLSSCFRIIDRKLK